MTRLILACCALSAVGCASVRPVRDDAVYRSGQLTTAQLKETVQKHNIKTVVNLRGFQPEERWYKEQTALLDRLGVKQVDLTLNPDKPDREEVNALLDVYRRAERPVLVHSRSSYGSVGLASGLYRVAIEHESNAKARRELALWQSKWVPIMPLHGHDQFLAEWKDEKTFLNDYQVAKRGDERRTQPQRNSGRPEEKYALDDPQPASTRRTGGESSVVLGEPIPVTGSGVADRPRAFR